MTTVTKPDLTKSATSRLTKGCVVKTGSGYRAEQGSDYFPAVSAETIGSQMIWFGKVTIPPGGRTKAHVHEHHESAFLLLSGDNVELWTGDELQHCEVAHCRRLPVHSRERTARCREPGQRAGCLHRLPERTDRAGKRGDVPCARRRRCPEISTVASHRAQSACNRPCDTRDIIHLRCPCSRTFQNYDRFQGSAEADVLPGRAIRRLLRIRAKSSELQRNSA